MWTPHSGKSSFLDHLWSIFHLTHNNVISHNLYLEASESQSIFFFPFSRELNPYLAWSSFTLSWVTLHYRFLKAYFTFQSFSLLDDDDDWLWAIDSHRWWWLLFTYGRLNTGTGTDTGTRTGPGTSTRTGPGTGTGTGTGTGLNHPSPSIWIWSERRRR